MFCKICRDAGKSESIYTSHNIYEGYGSDRKVSCPILKEVQCHACGEKGHTTSYCPTRKGGGRERGRSEGDRNRSRDSNCETGHRGSDRHHRRHQSSRPERAESHMERIQLPTHTTTPTSSPKRKAIPTVNDFPVLGRESKSWDQCMPPPPTVTTIDNTNTNTVSYIGSIKRFRDQGYNEERKEERKECEEKKKGSRVNTTADLVVSVMEKIQKDMKSLQEKVSKQEKTIRNLKDEVHELKKDGPRDKVNKPWHAIKVKEVTNTTTSPIPLIKPKTKTRSSPFKTSWANMSEEYDPDDEEMFGDSDFGLTDETVGVLCG